MLKDDDLINAMVSTLQSIPELLALLDGNSPASVVPYIDQYPKRNNVLQAAYTQKNGTVMVAWEDTVVNEAPEMSAWVHTVRFYLRPLSGGSYFAMADAIVDGVPAGGNQRWRYCPVMNGVLPTFIRSIGRQTDPEHIDVFIIETLTYETGDA